METRTNTISDVELDKIISENRRLKAQLKSAEKENENLKTAIADVVVD